MEQIPKIARQRLQATAKAGVHPDPNLLTAFVEKSLEKPERARVLEHLAQCGDCREVVSLALPEFEPAQVAAGERAGSRWLGWPVLRWGALATCVIVVGAAVTLRQQKSATELHLVETKQPAPAALADKATLDRQPSETDNKLPTVAESQARLRPESDMPARKMAKQVGQPASASANLTVMQSAPARSKDELSAVSKSQVAASAPAPAAPAKIAELEYRDARNEQTNDKLQSPFAGSTSGTVTVEADAVQVAEPATLGKTKLDAGKKLAESKTGAVVGGVAGITNQVAAAPRAENYSTLRGRAKLVPRWTLTSDGTLLRSLDAGKTWETIPVASNSSFRTLAAVGSDIWVGGAKGALYHSSDAGQNWIQVKPAVDGQTLAADIIGIEFTDGQHGKLTTANQETWTTADAGQTWQKK